ncbi:PD-(D/E)XK nuclease family protein [Erythrobacter sp.]|uniref:PD-(D/E)XK nuclease family protein n=1 Tax=Erythrobacter sp. TaxID=1042 RepID=UPI003C77317B
MRDLKDLEDVVELIDALDTENREKQSSRDASNINPFDFIPAGELSLSRLICWFLDPRASHGEGHRFIGSFIHLFGIAVPQESQVRHARCEVSTKAGRSIDIVVEFDDFTLAIENKPYSSFSEGQLPDYFAFLATRPRPFALIALKGWTGCVPADQIPPDHGANRQFIDTDYHMLIEWLGICIADARNAETGLFVRRFRDYVARYVLGIEGLENEQDITALVHQSPDRLLSALAVMDAGASIKSKLHSELVQAIIRLAPANWRAMTGSKERFGNLTGGYHYLTIDFKKDWPVVFVFEIAPHSNAAYLGVARRHRAVLAKAKADRIWKALDDHVHLAPDGGGSDWLWSAQQQHFAGRDWLNPEHRHIWKAMIDPDALAGRIVGLASAVERTIRENLDIEA